MSCSKDSKPQSSFSGLAALLLIRESEVVQSSDSNINSRSISPFNDCINECQEDHAIEKQYEFVITDDYADNSTLFNMMGFDLTPKLHTPYRKFKNAIMEKVPYSELLNALRLSQLFAFIEETLMTLDAVNVDKCCLDVFYMLLNWGFEESIEQNMEDVKGALNRTDISEYVLHNICKAVSQVPEIIRARNIKEIVTSYWEEMQQDPTTSNLTAAVQSNDMDDFLYEYPSFDKPITYEIPPVNTPKEQSLVKSLQSVLQRDIQLTRITTSNCGFSQRPEMIHWKNRIVEINQDEKDENQQPERIIKDNEESFSEIPTLAGPSNELSAAVLIEFVQSNISDSATVLKYLLGLVRSLDSDAAIQNEMLDLLGMKNIELVSKILANRKALANELNENFIRCRKLRKEINQGADIPSNPIVVGNIVVQSASGIKSRKKILKEEKKMKKEFGKVVNSLTDIERLQYEEVQRDALKKKELELAEQRIADEEAFRRNTPFRTKKNLPFVFDSHKNDLMGEFFIHGSKFCLPKGTIRKNFNEFEEITVPPPAEQNPVPEGFQVIKTSTLDMIGKKCFDQYKTLNTIQSLVFQQAYNTFENLLICAPTGAGKTNIALLTVLHTIRTNLDQDGNIKKNDFKVIYIAPMKALAAEMTANFSGPLAKLGLKVRELTGDTQLSKKEISETHMLILTPEKWDVVTRKTDDEVLTQRVRLMIIDEVHILHDERGPVIEAIVARALRQEEVSHQKIRIVGLSATLPNYIDVAYFLKVKPEKGLFFFDGRFRPVPLTQCFIGVHLGQNKSPLFETQMMDEACYKKCISFLRENHQVLVFVHSRNATSSLAKTFIEKAAVAGDKPLFLPNNVSSAVYLTARKAMEKARNRDLQHFFESGLGIHNAGLIRPDRTLMERMFAQGNIRVMFCTATLAWGVNLPAHAVVIRGTEIFDPTKGQFSDIGALDVQQIFGRAGRPQFESSGHGVIITTASKLPKYISMLTRQTPIESQFPKRILDHFNAEIARGTVSCIKDSVEWLRYTYFYIRAWQNPFEYGLDWKKLKEDTDLTIFLTDLSFETARKLHNNRMVNFDEKNQFLQITDMGKIASNYYISFESIEIFNDENGTVKLTQIIDDRTLLGLISSASEFSQIKARDSEMADLDSLASFGCSYSMKGGTLATTQGKVNCLLQCYISNTHIPSPTLVSESMYIAQNASRIARALFEIVLRRMWCQTTHTCLVMSKCIDKRMWPFNSPLRQLVPNFVSRSVVDKIEGRQINFSIMSEMNASDLGSMFSYDGDKLLNAVKMIPVLSIDHWKIRPMTKSMIEVTVVLFPSFIWNDSLLGVSGVQRFWLFFENPQDNAILHYESLLVTKKMVKNRTTMVIKFNVQISQAKVKNQFHLRIANDSFVVDDKVSVLSLHDVILPVATCAYTDLLDLDPLPVTVLKNQAYEDLYPFEYFNPIQTQVFHALYGTDENTLIGAPTSSGKTLCAELAILRLFNKRQGKKCVYIAPLKALVRERMADWKTKFIGQLGVTVVEVSGDHTPEVNELNSASILITTPEKWDGITRCMEARSYVKDVELLIIDEIHLLGVERGAVLEAIVTRIKNVARKRLLRKLPVRILGLSTALANAGDVAEWIDVKENSLYNFRPSVRPVPIDVHIQGFSGQHYCPRMAMMNKPAFRSIKQFSAVKPVLLFVASRRQTRLTAMAFVSLLALEDDPRQWLRMTDEELQKVMRSVKDDNLRIALSFGVGMHHAGLQIHERNLVEKLFVEKKIQVLIATATLAWGINVPAHLVIVKGTEYFDGKTNKYVDFPVTDVLQMIGRAGRPQYDNSAVAVVYVQDVKKNFYKKFLYEPFPVESSLLPTLANHVNAEICSDSIGSRQQVMEWLAGTYLYRRLFANPSYYGVQDFSGEGITKFMVSIVDESICELVKSRCAVADKRSGTIEASPLGKIGSKYYLDHLTVRHFFTTMRAGLTVEELLQILADCPEYREIPVRHNEDNVNQDLQKMLPIQLPPTTDWGSAHVKTHLLYQAHFSRVQVPVDYLTDQRSILESCIRIIQAMFDFCLVLDWLDTALNVLIILQQIMQARWYSDHPLLCLPHMSAHSIDGLAPFSTIPQLQDQLGIYGETSLPETRIRKVVGQIMHSSILENYEARELIDALLKWPIVQVLDVRLQSGLQECPIAINATTCAIPVQPSEQYNLCLRLQLLGAQGLERKAYCPKFPKDRTFGWTVVLGNKKSGQIMACNKSINCGNNGNKLVKLLFTAPSIRGDYCFTIFLFSDTYLGIDQEFSFYCSVQ